MIAIVRNLALRYLKSKDKAAVPLSVWGIDIQDQGKEEGNDIDLKLLLAAIESLPDGNREVFKLSVLDGLSHKEIGALLGIHPHSSSSQLFRAKKMLRAMLGKYWLLFLLPILIPFYLYFVARNKSAGIAEDQSATVNSHKKATVQAKKASEKAKTDRNGYAVPSITRKDGNGRVATITTTTDTTYPQTNTDSAEKNRSMQPILADSVQRLQAFGGSINDSLYLVPRISDERMVVVSHIPNLNTGKKRYPWTFNLGYSSNAGAGGAMSNLDYLSFIDYANGGTMAKIYTWGALEDYYARNVSLMDSVESARMSLILSDHQMDDDSPLGEVAHHHRPITFSLSLNKQLSPRWMFGTGVSFTRLKSEFESDYNKERLVKTQTVDYVGVPLRLSYSIWRKGRFNAYATGGVTFEVPVHSTLDKHFVVTVDSTFTLKGDIKPGFQWSVNLGVGVQYQLLKPFSLYLEPNMYYYFRNGSGVETYRTEHPFIITVPFGLRLTW